MKVKAPEAKETVSLKPSSRATRTTQPPKATTPESSLPSLSATPTEPSSTRPRPPRAVPPAISLTLSSPKKAASAEPPAHRISLRRSSNISLPSSKLGKPAAPAVEPTTTRSGRRGKRPTPGLVTTHSDDGGAKVSVGARRAAPGRLTKKTTAIVPKKSTARDSVPPTPVTLQEEEFLLDVDPDEPRYCVCEDVSYGTMVACEADDCEREWFHLECVGLAEIPGRRQKWYCPDCRARLKVGENGQKL